MIAVLILIFLIVVAYYFFNRRDECAVLQTIHHDDYVIEIVNAVCKEGLPHTTGPHTVRMTLADWEGPRRDDILRHEVVHLKQRRAVNWLDFYKTHWGYTCAASPPEGVPAEFVARLRPNPDTAADPWATWRGRWLFFPVFTEDGSLRGAEVIVWDLDNHRQAAIPDEWKAEFCGAQGCPHQYEHPHEISAEWIAGGSDASAAKKLFDWLK